MEEYLEMRSGRDISTLSIGGFGTAAGRWKRYQRWMVTWSLWYNGRNNASITALQKKKKITN